MDINLCFAGTVVLLTTVKGVGLVAWDTHRGMRQEVAMLEWVSDFDTHRPKGAVILGSTSPLKKIPGTINYCCY